MWSKLTTGFSEIVSHFSTKEVTHQQMINSNEFMLHISVILEIAKVENVLTVRIPLIEEQ